MSHCSLTAPGGSDLWRLDPGWIPAQRGNPGTATHPMVFHAMEHGAPSRLVKTSAGSQVSISRCCGHGAAVCFPLAMPNTSQEALSPGHPARTSSCPSSSVFSSSPFNPKLPFWEDCYQFWGNVTHVLLRSCPSSGCCAGRSLWLALESAFSSPAPRHRHQRSPAEHSRCSIDLGTATSGSGRISW